MKQWTLNWGEVREDMVIGSCPMAADDIPRIRGETGVTALLSLQTDECRGAFDIDLAAIRQACADRELALVNAPMRDFDPPDQRRNLPLAVTELVRLLARGHRVYVHCTSGINRAPLTVLGYLSFVEGRSRDDAMALILAGRPEAEPYGEAYEGCWADLVEREHQAIGFHAHLLSEREPHLGPDEHWYRAEREVVRNVFLALAAEHAGRHDPHRP